MHRASVQGLSGRPKYRRVPNVPTATDLVQRKFARSDPDRLWVTDITEHPTREGKIYCCVVLDVFSRRVVGWSIDSNQETSLVTNALGMALSNRTPTAQTVIHSDQPIHVVVVHQPGDRRRAPPVDGFRRRLLRQRPHGVILEPGPSGAARPKAVDDPTGAGDRPLRVPGDLPQSPTSALVAWHDDPGGVRAPPRSHGSGLIPVTPLHRTQDTPEPPRIPGQFKKGRADYARRKAIVEPAFGQMKVRQARTPVNSTCADPRVPKVSGRSTRSATT